MSLQIKQISIITVLLIAFVVDIAKCQQYSLQSLNGDRIKIQLSVDDNRRILSVIYSVDTIWVRDVEELKSVETLHQQFLIINYRVRAGSGMSETRTLLLSASNNKINLSLDIISLFHEDFLDFNNYVTSPMKVEIKSIYKVKFDLTGNNIFNYKVAARIHELRTSVHAPKTNYNYHLRSTLHFDKNQNVFCNLYENLSASFIISDPKTQKEIKKYIKGNYAVAQFGNYKYYYINREWYHLAYKNALTKVAYR